MSTQTLRITKSWRWGAGTSTGWKALATLTSSDPYTPTQQVIISHAESTVPRTDETMVFGCKQGTDDPNWGDVLRAEPGSASPHQLFPRADIQIDSGVEELWRES